MDPLLRQRIVGTLVLVALGVVFWPLIFVTPETREPIVLQPMSQRPAIDQTPIPEPESYEAAVAPNLPEPPRNPRRFKRPSILRPRPTLRAVRLLRCPLATRSPRRNPG